MSQLDQEVDAIIAEENITDATSATEEPVDDGSSDDVQGASDTTDGATSADDSKPVDDTTETDTTAASDKAEPDVVTDEQKPAETKPEDTQPTTDLDTKSPGEMVDQAKSLIQNLDLDESKIFNEDGTAKPWEEVVPAGAYFASQLAPVKVVDKDGKTHEFLLLSDVESKFPDGFEAKNNIEQMKFERAILGNETKFDEAVKQYNDAKIQYTKETSDMVQSRGENERIGKEYRAMAEQGLVPKAGDPNDPKFLESPAVKELNNILNWMDTKNKELSSKGLGQINSLYVAKQLMDVEGTSAKKTDEAKKVTDERKEVASMSSTGASDTKDTGRQSYSNVPLSRLADEIIQSEGLK